MIGTRSISFVVVTNGRKSRENYGNSIFCKLAILADSVEGHQTTWIDTGNNISITQIKGIYSETGSE